MNDSIAIAPGIRVVQRLFAVMAAVAFLAGCASTPSTGLLLGKVLVGAELGDVKYASNGIFVPLKADVKLEAGTIIQTGLSSLADLEFNGDGTDIRIPENSTVELASMDVHGRVTATVLTVKHGQVTGNLMMLSPGSRLQIQSSNGLARCHGWDFRVTATDQPAGKVGVIFCKDRGRLLVSALVDNQTVTKLVKADQFWVPGQGNPSLIPPDAPAVVFDNERRPDDPMFTTAERAIVAVARRRLESDTSGEPIDAYYRVQHTTEGYEVFVSFVTGYDFDGEPSFGAGLFCVVDLREDGSIIRVLGGA